MGLIQTCQILRREFRRMYIDTWTLDIRITDLHRFINTFGTEEMAQHVGHVIAKLEQSPLTEEGVEILPMIRYLQQHTIEVHSRYPQRSKWDVLDFPTYICRVDLQYITSINLSRRTSGLYRYCLEVMVDAASDDCEINYRRLMCVYYRFIWRAGLETCKELLVDFECGEAGRAAFTANMFHMINA